VEPRRILIVDDEPNMRTTLADILAEEGYETVVAESGERALQLFDKQRFDLVLLDVRMPGMDGMDVFRHMRAKRRGAQVALMSAYSMDVARRQALDEGALAFVRKPLDVESLLRLLRGSKELTVLAVEAEPCVAGPIADRLRAEGSRVLVTSSASEAVELMRQIHSHVVFLDETLVERSGHAFLVDLRHAGPSSRLVLVGRAPSPATVQPGVALVPVDAVLLRPLRLDDVLGVLQPMRGVRAAEPA
jgi:DNA-binding response OmpR family regulator